MKLEKVRDVKVPIAVVLGEAELSLSEVADLGAGTVIELSRSAGDKLDVLAAGELVARGEVVVIDESLGVRITEVLEREG
jgi:flagellar motor switch protein FliN